MYASDDASGHFDIRAWDNIEEDHQYSDYWFGTWRQACVDNDVSGTNATAYIYSHNTSCSDYAEAS